MRIRSLQQRNQSKIKRLLEIWHASVVETHTFLTEADIAEILPAVRLGLEKIKNLYGYYDDKAVLQAFIGMENQKIEMLFVDAAARGQGIGRQLVDFAIANAGTKYVDVNEQNAQGVGFYSHIGFHLISRSEFDGQGRPFPLLHLEFKKQ